MSSVGATRACHLPKLAASPPGQSVAVFSSRHTGSVSFSGPRCNVASGWTLTIDCATCKAHRNCMSPIEQYVARQPAGNKKQCNTLYLSRSGPSFTSLNTFIHMAVSLHIQYVAHTGHVLHVGNLHMSCNAHACRPV